MKKQICIVFFSILALTCCTSFSKLEKTNLTDHNKDDFYLGGVQANEPNLNQWVKTLKKTGMNTVEVTVYAFQGDWDSDNFWFNEKEKAAVKEIRTAKRNGLKVVLILHVHLDNKYSRNKFLWHGMIMPKNSSLIDSWFEKYQAFVLNWARISEEEGVDVLAVGSEMNALSATRPIANIPSLYQYFNSRRRQLNFESKALEFSDILTEKHLWVHGGQRYPNLENYLNDKIHAQVAWANQVTFVNEPSHLAKMNTRRERINNHWGRIIAETRKVYSGKLTYGANFDNYRDVGFWNKLDFMGVNAYFKLRDLETSTEIGEDLMLVLKKGWNKAIDQISTFARDQGLERLPVLFTELGYIYRANATVEPWTGYGYSIIGSGGNEKLILWEEQKYFPKERTLAVQALRQVYQERQFNLAGILYWNLTTIPQYLKEEPFALHIAEEPTDELQEALLEFLK